MARRSGEEIDSRQVVDATDPVVLATKLLAPGNLPQSTHDQIRGLMTAINPIDVFKADIALSRPPKFCGLGHDNIDRDLVSCLSMCPSMADFPTPKTFDA